MVSFSTLLFWVSTVSALPRQHIRRQGTLPITNLTNPESLDSVVIFNVINYDWKNTLVPWAQKWNGTLLELLEFDRGLDIATNFMDAVANNLNQVYPESSLNSADSATVISQLQDSLEPEIAIIAKGLVAPKANYEAAVLQVVKYTLSDLAGTSVKYANSLVRIVDAGHKATLQGVADKIASDWAAAVAALG